MKKIFTTLAICALSLIASTNAATIDDAVSWAYEGGLTIFKEPVSFMASKSIRRDEAAKIFTNFAKLLEKNRTIVDQNQCNFSDLDKAWDDLRPVIVESCVYGLFKGDKGKFNPTGNITNAEAITVLVRLIDGYQSEKLVHRADNYYNRADELGIDNVYKYSKDIPATRGDIIMLVYEVNNKFSGTTREEENGQQYPEYKLSELKEGGWLGLDEGRIYTEDGLSYLEGERLYTKNGWLYLGTE